MTRKIIIGVVSALMLAVLGSGGYMNWRHFQNDVNWQHLYNGTLRFGEDCEAAVGEGHGQDSMDEILALPHTFVKFAMPYKAREQTLAVKVPKDGYLIARCEAPTDKLSKEGFAAMRFGRAYGDTAVYVNGDLRLTQADNGHVLMPLTPKDRRTKAVVTIISKSRPPFYFAGLVTSEPLLVTDNRDVLEGVSLATANLWGELPAFRWGLGLGLGIFFGIVWVLGIKKPEVSWMVVLASAFTLQNALIFAPLGSPAAWQTLAFGLLEGASAAAIAGFTLAFLRLPKRHAAPYWVFGIFAVIYGFGYLVLPTSVTGDSPYRLTLPYAAGGLFLLVVSGIGFKGLRTLAGRAKKDAAVLASLALICGLLYLGQVVASVYGVVYVTFVKILFLVLFAGWLGSDLVVTYRKHADEKAARQQADLVARTAQVLVHDLKSPFSTVNMVFETIAHPQATPDKILRIVNLFLPTMRRAMDTATRIIEAAVDFSTPLVPKKEETVVREIFEAALGQVRLTRSLGNVTVRLDVEEGVAGVFDQHLILRAVQNVLENAVDAMQGKGQLVLRAGPARDFRHVQLSVWNDGPAIPEGDLENVFEAFFSTKGKRGSGLGLYGARAAVLAHGGRIWATSEVGGGTEFFMTLPAAHPNLKSVVSGLRRRKESFKLIASGSAGAGGGAP